MAIILNTNDLLDALADLRDGGAITRDEYQAEVKAAEAATQRLASFLASREGVTLHDVSFQGGFGGLCATFKPGSGGKTSDVLAAGDVGGDWEY